MKKIRDLNFDLKQLRSFLEVLNQKSFTRASRRLKVGQATISHHIRELEESFGTELIIRNSKKIALTEQGRMLLAFCEKMFAGVDDLVSYLDRGPQGGIVRIAASTIPSAYILPKMLVAIKNSFPDIVYRMEVADSREAVEMVKEGRADVGIVGKEYKHPALVYAHFYRDEIVLIGPRACPDKLALKDLSGLQFIIREPGSGTRKAYEQALAERGFMPSELTVVMECSTNEAIRESVAAGLGVSFLSRLAVSDDNRKKLLKIIEVAGLDIKRKFHTVIFKKRPLSRPVAILIDSLARYGRKGEMTGG